MEPIDRAAYGAHALSKRHLSRLAKSTNIMQAAAGCAVSVSWGKDSVAMLHLAASIRPDVAVINARYPNPAERFDDMDRVRDAVLSRADMARIRYTEVSCPGEWEMYERAGGGFAACETHAQREAAHWWRTQFNAHMSAAREACGCSGVMLGLRADESHARAMNAASRGADYYRADGNRVVQPLMHWSGVDVWAYLVSHDLPWLRIYDSASSGRVRARSGFVFATSGSGALRRHGVWDDWRCAYPNEYAAWMTRFPELDR